MVVVVMSVMVSVIRRNYNASADTPYASWKHTLHMKPFESPSYTG